MANQEESTTSVQAWFCSTDLPSDVVIQVQNTSFHLHKLPLMLKSQKLQGLITEPPEMSKSESVKIQKHTENEESDEEDDENYCHITLPNFPGGAEAFEWAAKFCYGLKIDFSPSNIAALRCAADFLQMTEEHFEDNLVSITEKYLSQKVLRNIKYSIQTLYSCQSLLPLAENIGIVSRCIHSIAANSSSSDPSVLGWPINGGGRVSKSSTPRRSHFSFEELSMLNLQIFKRLISEMREQNTKPEFIEGCLMIYSRKHKLLSSRANRKSLSCSSSSSSIPSENEQRELLETIVAILPREKSSNSPNSTKFLCGLLRTAYILKASEGCRSILEKKIGSQLEQATLDDLLIPSYSYLNDTLYDVDCVERILAYFLQGLDSTSSGGTEGVDDGRKLPDLTLVGKLIDDVLSEIASDANLKPERFYQLAISLPEPARQFDDGLYRAVDVFLKVHPWISEGEREEICSILECQKLTPEACAHATQNERLPLRTVVQVLFFEQLQLRLAIAENVLSTTVSPAKTPALGGFSEDYVPGTAKRTSSSRRDKAWENRMLRLGIDGMRTKVHELEHECSSMKKVIEKIDKVGGKNGDAVGCWSIGCKFNTQVCDSQQSSAVVEYRKTRSHRHRHQLAP